MGKSLVSNAASAKNKKLGVAKSKSTTVGKNIVKKRVEIIIITETLIVNMLLCGHSIAGEIFGCKGQVLWSGESTTSLNHVRHL